jgi:hypothetical protein
MLVPDYETEVDFLNCEAISRTVTELLRDNRSRALTVGIHGDWGAGKSSILKMVEMELSQDKDVACLWFNGWAFQGFDDAKTVLIEATITELSRQRSDMGKVKDLAAKLMKRIDWLKVAKRGTGLAINVATGLPSPDQIETAIGAIKTAISSMGTASPEEIEDQLTEAASFLKPGEAANVPEVIHHFREDFSALLAEAKIKQLVVLIDDLDRCLPATAIETLEAIRLFLFVPKTAFIIGADEAMIEYAVREHFPDLPVASGPMPYARNYLEKLIQVPFRIPALGSQETRIYILLLLIESIVGSEHAGFKKILAKAKDGLNKPWLGVGLTQAEVHAVDVAKKDDLDAAFVLSAQIGPVLAEGTRGNPRQIKRFLNALMIRQSIAKARGFSDLIHQPVLAKLMLAERYQPDFYDHLAAEAMQADDGKVKELLAIEAGAAPEPDKKGVAAKRRKVDEDDGEANKWLEREWLRRWVKIPPALSNVDLRPYVFVARDKRMLAAAGDQGGLPALIDKLSASGLALRAAEPAVKSLPASEAEAAFNALREKVLSISDLTSPPPGFEGLGIIAKHHERFQPELMALLGSLDVKRLGMWIVKGWNEVITDPKAKTQLTTVMNQWARQEDNTLLKRAAGQALSGLKPGGK